MDSKHYCYAGSDSRNQTVSNTTMNMWDDIIDTVLEPSKPLLGTLPASMKAPLSHCLQVLQTLLIGTL